MGPSWVRPERTISAVLVMTATRRLLAIHPGALGDVLQAVPALRALRGDAGDRHLSLAAQPRLARLLAGAGVVDEALSFEALGLAASSRTTRASGAGRAARRLRQHRLLVRRARAILCGTPDHAGATGDPGGAGAGRG